MQTVWSQIRPDKVSGLIWSQTVWHPDGIPEDIFEKVNLKKKSTDNKKACKITQHAKINEYPQHMIYWRNKKKENTIISS